MRRLTLAHLVDDCLAASLGQARRDHLATPPATTAIIISDSEPGSGTLSMRSSKRLGIGPPHAPRRIQKSLKSVPPPRLRSPSLVLATASSPTVVDRQPRIKSSMSNWSKVPS